MNFNSMPSSKSKKCVRVALGVPRLLDGVCWAVSSVQSSERHSSRELDIKGNNEFKPNGRKDGQKDGQKDGRKDGRRVIQVPPFLNFVVTWDNKIKKLTKLTKLAG